jgi:hypothetical protein
MRRYDTETPMAWEPLETLGGAYFASKFRIG